MSWSMGWRSFSLLRVCLRTACAKALQVLHWARRLPMCVPPLMPSAWHCGQGRGGGLVVMFVSVLRVRGSLGLSSQFGREVPSMEPDERDDVIMGLDPDLPEDFDPDELDADEGESADANEELGEKE